MSDTITKAAIVIPRDSSRIRGRISKQFPVLLTTKPSEKKINYMPCYRDSQGNYLFTLEEVEKLFPKVLAKFARTTRKSKVVPFPTCFYIDAPINEEETEGAVEVNVVKEPAKQPAPKPEPVVEEVVEEAPAEASEAAAEEAPIEEAPAAEESDAPTATFDHSIYSIDDEVQIDSKTYLLTDIESENKAFGIKLTKAGKPVKNATPIELNLALVTD